MNNLPSVDPTAGRKDCMKCGKETDVRQLVYVHLFPPTKNWKPSDTRVETWCPKCSDPLPLYE